MELDLTAHGVALIPLIAALIEVAKRIGLPAKYAPIPALLLGVAAGVLYVAPDDIRAGVLIGLSIGLGSMGIYELVDHGTDAIRDGRHDHA